jgi:hypothetical protein
MFVVLIVEAIVCLVVGQFYCDISMSKRDIKKSISIKL